MDYTQDLYFSDIFNFSDFVESGYLSDCEIRIHPKDGDSNYTVVKGHKLVLANSSLFFNNTFTAGMEESQTGIVDTYVNPYNLLPRVINWMYTGRIEFSVDELMPLLNISHNYGILVLEKELLAQLDEVADENTVLGLVKKCYEDEMSKELQILIPYIAKFFDKLSLSKLSEELDVATFAKAIGLTQLSTKEKVLKITEFLQDWQPSMEEKMALFNAFSPDETRLKEFAMKHNARWLP
ncbi:BTB/POZ domain containing protein [Tritrichomonas foetus]|uniref:BTB/POZ domain containing protein n=1 Tax=Tritrichomonas foetus TaxID=1144522 RepID=A0A1J4JJ39_9EUKA|nr:BTB/POZ domain containing protein [Tritrichomonas foetus]|eukprot:OHS98367.1 BTB/POZ domain containing protein [Tritrichomonas foetus]